jgi:hypothetical protein
MIDPDYLDLEGDGEPPDDDVLQTPCDRRAKQ